MADKEMFPSVFKPVGEVLTRQGTRLQVVARPVDLLPKDACAGCFFSEGCGYINRLQCSPFDRQDRTGVWFVPIGSASK